MMLSHPNQSKELANGSERLENGIFVQKYIEAVVRKSSRLQILAEIDHFENFGRVSKIPYKEFALKKTKLIMPFGKNPRKSVHTDTHTQAFTNLGHSTRKPPFGGQ